jgi:hypothetical protein
MGATHIRSGDAGKRRATPPTSVGAPGRLGRRNIWSGPNMKGDPQRVTTPATSGPVIQDASNPLVEATQKMNEEG